MLSMELIEKEQDKKKDRQVRDIWMLSLWDYGQPNHRD